MSSSPPLRKRSPPDVGSSNDASSSGARANAVAAAAKRTRSRNGCLVCRARRIKCDLERPECKRCVNYGAECVYPVKKAFDPAAVDAALGSRHNRPSKVAATAVAYQDIEASPPGYSNASPPTGPPVSAVRNQPPRADQRNSLADLPPMEMVHALFRNTKMGSYFNNPGVSPPEFLQHAFPNAEDLRCFHHCLTYSLSLMVIDEEHNPWVEHIAPMFLFPTGDAPLSTSALKYAMLAIGATHLAYLEATTRLPTSEDSLQLSKEYRHNALGLLRQARRVPGELAHDAFLAASLMIVDNDILAANVSWREPLRYAKAAIAHRGGAGNVLFGQDWRSALAGRKHGAELAAPLSARRYLIEHGVMHDILSCFTSGASPTILDNDSPWWEALGATGNSDREWESVESLVGFDRPLVRMLATILTLCSQWRRFEAHYRPLNELDPAVSLHSPAAMERMELSRRLADVQIELATWRAEAQARYMAPRTMIGSMTLWHSAQIIVLRDMQKRGRDDPDVQSSAAAVLELCIEAGDKVEFLNWSLVIACSVLLDPDKRNEARGIVKTFAYQCCHEIESSRVVIEEMWRRIDEGYDDEACNWREVLLEIGRPVLIG